jgi:glycerol-3-phosphate dehydrogenase
MNYLSHEQRAGALERMAAEGVDVLVVGGGITGAGVALDAAARGYRVGLVERGDFAGGTSGKSTKLVHGGIRYLSQLDFGLMREALIERGLLLRNAPFLVQPVGFVLPLYRGARRLLGTSIAPPFGIGMDYMMQAGLLIYDVMSGRLGIRRHRRVSPARAAQIAPCLKTRDLRDVFIYYDAQTDDARLTVTVIRTAALHGALVANYAELMGFEQRDGRVTAARVRDHVRGQTLGIAVGTVVNAAGVYAEQIEKLAGPPTIRITPAKGAHLTVARESVKIGRHAIVLPETEDGRVLFIVPWGNRAIIGTTDTLGGDVSSPEAAPEDIDYLLRHANRYLQCRLAESDIISAWAGYRPLVSSRKSDVVSSKLSRTHAVIDGPGGIVSIVGGKLTTYRRMAQDAVDRVARRRGDPPSRVTERLPLSGSEGWREAAEAVKGATPRFGLRADTVRRLVSYGSNGRAILDLLQEDPVLSARIVADLPYIMAEVIYACRYEMSIDLSDVLERRLRISFEDRFHGAIAAPAVATLMARELGWDGTEVQGQIKRYREARET